MAFRSSCFIPRLDAGYLSQIRGLLDSYNLDRVFAKGHPNGLQGGEHQDAYREMIRCFESARNIGAKVMRVVGSTLMFRHQPHEPQIARLTGMFREAVKIAEEYGIRMANSV
jgi:3-oxoisoapionate decarboxylase